MFNSIKKLTRELNMKIIEATNTNDFAIKSVEFFENFVANNKDSLITLPTGNTPLPFYEEMVKAYQKNNKINEFTYLSLDEYYGLQPDDHRLFANWLDREILTPIGLDKSKRITINSACTDVGQFCQDFEGQIESKGGIDLAIIGIGANGHIGFNEPGSDLNSPTQKVELTQETITSNAEYWGSEDAVPKSAITIGIGTLKKARNTLLLVRGANKAEIFKATLNNEISSAVPSTYLQEQDNLTVIADKEALKLL